MLFFDGGLALVFVALWLFCIIDVITTPEGACRNLPKWGWLIIVLVLPDIGSLAWLIAGHPWQGVAQSNLPYKGNSGNRGDAAARYPEYDRPTRQVATNPDDDEEFLAGLRARAEEQRRRAREAKRQEELREQGKPEDDHP